MIKAVIFDFGGVVMRERASATEILSKIFDEPVDKIRELARPMLLAMSVGEMKFEDCIQQLSMDLGKQVPKDVEEIWDKMTSTEADLFPTVVDLVNSLKSKVAKVVVLSNSIPPFAKRNKKINLYKDFDSYYLSCEIGFRKPQVEAYQYVLDKEGLLAPECIFIDDKEKNLVPAKNLGMKVVWAQNPKQVVNEVLSLIQ